MNKVWVVAIAAAVLIAALAVYAFKSEHGRRGSFVLASTFVTRYPQAAAKRPEALEALSWVARRELSAGRYEQAYQDAEKTQQLCDAALRDRKLDDEPRLPIALGAAYEVEAQALNKMGRTAEAIGVLQTALTKWRGTSIAERLQKNLNLLTLNGKPMPALRETEWIGAKPLGSQGLHGKVVLLYFWAHWCSDCKAEAPAVAQVAREFEPRGLVVIGPTKLYGYTAANDHAPATEEKAFIEKVYDRFYADIPNIQVPLDGANFERYGASTTPTNVIVDRKGVVRLYRPGAMDESELRAAIEPLIDEENVESTSMAR